MMCVSVTVEQDRIREGTISILDDRVNVATCAVGEARHFGQAGREWSELEYPQTRYHQTRVDEGQQALAIVPRGFRRYSLLLFLQALTTVEPALFASCLMIHHLNDC
jgi:hypothetical protein